MSFVNDSAIRSSLAFDRSMSSEPVGHGPQVMDSELTNADLEAATALVCLSGRPVHRYRLTPPAALVSAKSLRPFDNEGPPQKRVRFQVEKSPDEPIPTPPLTRSSSVDTVDSPPDGTENRPLVDGVNAADTFERDRAYANGLAKHCQQPLYSAYSSKSMAESTMLTFKRHAAWATKMRRHASRSVDIVPNTPNENTDTTPIATSQSTHRNMESFWQTSGAENGFMPFLQPDPRAAGEQYVPTQPGLDSLGLGKTNAAKLTEQDPVEALFPQNRLLEQNETNKALFAAIEKMHGDIIRTSTSNQSLYEHVGSLRGRIETLEQENMQLKAVVEGLRGGKRQAPKLSLAIANLDLNDHPGLPTPSTGTLSGTTLAFPSRPTTSTGVVFPKSAISSSTASSFAETTPSSFEAPTSVPPTPTTPGSRTVLYKKDKHDLTGKLPPANVKLPLVPLTDVELIVFFYNSTSRPIVSVRLYARGGPNVIAQIINEHRVVKPEGYKRNTCSVHCNKAVKTFIRENGEEYKKQMSGFFEKANDIEATNAIRHDESELSNTCDYAVLKLFRDLIKFPSGGQKGIFTDCIRWCLDNQVDAKVSQVHLIAHALSNGTDPRDNLDLPTPSADRDANMLSHSSEEEPVQGKRSTDTVSSSDLTSLSEDDGGSSSVKSSEQSENPKIKTESPSKD